jgi:hypothetical protein
VILQVRTGKVDSLNYPIRDISVDKLIAVSISGIADRLTVRARVEPVDFPRIAALETRIKGEMRCDSWL